MLKIKDDVDLKIVKISSEADKMFEELGYGCIEETNRYLRYSTDNLYGDHIDFDLKLKRVRCTSVSTRRNTHFRYAYIQELKAINQKCKELGWLDNTSVRVLEYADNPITP